MLHKIYQNQDKFSGIKKNFKFKNIIFFNIYKYVKLLANAYIYNVFIMLYNYVQMYYYFLFLTNFVLICSYYL